MNKYSFTNNGKTWERITKKQARAAYNNGLTVLFCPVNMRPFTPWHLEIDVNKNFKSVHGFFKSNAVIRRFISRLQRLIDSPGKRPRRTRWERSNNMIIALWRVEK